MMQKLFFFAACIFSFSVAAEGAPDEQDSSIHLPKVIRVGETVVVDSFTNLHTALVVDNEGTAFLMSTYGNGDVRTLRVSPEGVVKQAITDHGWPYIVDKKGRLYAMDISWRTIMMAKMPGLMRREVHHFRYAAGTGIGLLALNYINYAVNFGLFDPNFVGMAKWGLAGFAAFYISDFAYAALFRSPAQLGAGGNLFRTKLAAKVESLKFNSELQTYDIHFHGSNRRSEVQYLRDLAPSFTRNTSCIYYLTTLVNR